MPRALQRRPQTAVGDVAVMGRAGLEAGARDRRRGNRENGEAEQDQEAFGAQRSAADTPESVRLTHSHESSREGDQQHDHEDQRRARGDRQRRVAAAAGAADLDALQLLGELAGARGTRPRRRGSGRSRGRRGRAGSCPRAGRPARPRRTRRGSARPRWASRPSRCASPRGSTQMRSAISGGGARARLLERVDGGGDLAGDADRGRRAQRAVGQHRVQPPARRRLGDGDRVALERARVVDAEQVRVVDGAEPVGALEEAHGRERAGRIARHVQRHRAPLALLARAARRRSNPLARRPRCGNRRTRPRVARCQP